MWDAISAIVAIFKPIIERAIPDPAAAAKAQEDLTKALQANFATLYDAMKSVMVADAASESGLVRNARPIVVYWSLSVITLIVFSSIFGVSSSILDALNAVPSKLWDLVTVGIGAYILGRSAEKAVSNLKGK